METVKEGFEDLMSKVYPEVDKNSLQYKESKTVFHAAVIWTMATLSDAIRAKEPDVVGRLEKELHEFVKQNETAFSIVEDILKSGGE